MAHPQGIKSQAYSPIITNNHRYTGNTNPVRIVLMALSELMRASDSEVQIQDY